jgi:hypothetical protein
MSDLEASDLVCRSRRERLSSADEQRLSRLLQSSEEARFHADVLDQAEKDSCVQAGDDALVARMAGQALEPVTNPVRRRIRVHALQLAAAVLLVGAMAGALGWSSLLESVLVGRTFSVKAADPALPVSAPRSGQRPRAHPVPGTAIIPTPSSSPADAIPPAKPTVALAAGAPSAAELLARANLARREGRTDEARRSYESIVGAHPRSREAPLAHLALGKLYESGQPALALTHFSVLADGGGGLRAEGLWGKAECARRLGRQAAEQQALRTLVQQFPASSYAAAARGRVLDGLP